MRSPLEVTPKLYAKVSMIALGAVTLIVLTGAAVRLTGSGLGCPDWPKCYGRPIAPLESHAIIEFSNRLLSGLVGIAVIAAGALAWRRRPFRWHLALFGALLPLGVVCQAILGGVVVRYHLAPGLVMSHFILSMMLLDAAFALFWCSTFEPGERAPSHDRLGVWAVRALVPLGQLTIVAGTFATASGPHAGAHAGQLVQRFRFRGGGTLAWVVERHSAAAAIFGVAAVGVWLLLRLRRSVHRAQRPVTVLLSLLVTQGVVGGIQYALRLPSEIVWVHVTLATATWLSVLWAVGAAGRLAPAHPRPERRESIPALEAVGAR